MNIKKPEEYLAFSGKYAASQAVRDLSPHDLQLILNLQSENAAYMRQDSYNALDRLFARDDYPLIDDTLILYRGGKTSPKDPRDYISATVFPAIAQDYSGDDPVSTITVEKGAKILPLRALHRYAGDGEGEIIICTRHLIRTIYPRRFMYR